MKAFRPYFEEYPIFKGSSLDDYMERTPLTVGSPQEVIDKTLTFQEGFGDYQRQLFALDGLALPVELALEQVELLGTEVVPVLRKEMAARRAPGVPDAPTHASLVTREVRRRRAAPAATEPEPRRQPLGRVPLPGQRPRRRSPLPAGGVTMTSDFRLANEAWEAYYRTQATLGREFADADIWDGLLTREYAVLYALSSEPDGLRITELGDDVLLTQPGMSRLIARLEAKGLVERTADADDGRARRIRLTVAGTAAQRRVGANLARTIAGAMTRALDTEQLTALRDLSVALLAGASGTAARVQQNAMERTLS